jgi:predicted dehydrogenase
MDRAPVTVDDRAAILVRFEEGVEGNLEATRFATGRKNANRFEIYGDRGGLHFNLERLNELEFCSLDDPEDV